MYITVQHYSDLLSLSQYYQKHNILCLWRMYCTSTWFICNESNYSHFSFGTCWIYGAILACYLSIRCRSYECINFLLICIKNTFFICDVLNWHRENLHLWTWMWVNKRTTNLYFYCIVNAIKDILYFENSSINKLDCQKTL